VIRGAFVRSNRERLSAMRVTLPRVSRDLSSFAAWIRAAIVASPVTFGVRPASPRSPRVLFRARGASLGNRRRRSTSATSTRSWTQLFESSDLAPIALPCSRSLLSRRSISGGCRIARLSPNDSSTRATTPSLARRRPVTALHDRPRASRIVATVARCKCTTRRLRLALAIGRSVLGEFRTRPRT